ncbi:MAG: helix-turn-helix domain-containing protein [Polyangiaceae bacterium]
MDERSRKPLRHYAPELPRSSITLPAPVVRGALREPLLAGLFPSHVGCFPRARGHAVERERPLTSSVFNYCVRGKGWCVLAGARHEVVAGDLMVAPQGHVHAYGSNPDDPWTLHWFHAMGSHVPLLLEQLGATVSEPVVRLGRESQLEALFVEVRQSLEDDYSDNQLLYAAQALTHLVGLMIRLARSHGGEPRSAAKRVEDTLQHMRRHLASSHSVGELAGLAELSASHYSELVRARTGYPPKEYLTRIRVHRAAQLLDTSEQSVQAIAREVGFADPLHFSRVFRRIHELSPTQFRVRRSSRRERS